MSEEVPAWLKPEIFEVYADGGIIGKNPSPIGGTWAFCYVNLAGARIYGISGYILIAENLTPEQNARAMQAGYVLSAHHGRDGLALMTNNHTEYIALCKALSHLPEDWSGSVYSDSRVTLGRLFWGWRHKNIPLKWIQRALWQGGIVERLGKCQPVWLKGHPTPEDLERGFSVKGMPVSLHQDWCDKECQALAETLRCTIDGEEYHGINRNGAARTNKKSSKAVRSVAGVCGHDAGQ